MANSAEIGAGEIRAKKSQYNNLRKDVLDPTTGHDHSGAADHGILIPNTSLATAAIGPTASTVMLRDPSGNSQVAAPVDPEDVARLDTFMDIMQAQTVVSNVDFTLPGAFGDITDFHIHFTNVKTCIAILFLSVKTEPIAGYVSSTWRADLDGTPSLDDYNTAVSNVSESIGATFAFESVAAGSHTIKAQGMAGSTDSRKAAERRLVLLLIPIA